MEHDTPGFARILEEYGSVSWDFRATTRPFSRSVRFELTRVVKTQAQLSSEQACNQQSLSFDAFLFSFPLAENPPRDLQITAYK